MNGLAGQNWNMFASSILVDVCRKFGSVAFFVSPGYRDAPFIAALQSRDDLELYSCFDERAAAFQALGWAKARQKPAVLICTSGTAGANYLPAIIEAKIDHVPLLVITADRPFELVFANAQQVMDQRDLFGRFVKKSFDFPAPSQSMNVRAWMSYTKLLLETAMEGLPGPVHLNLPFTAPLDPIVHESRPSETQIAATAHDLERLRFSVGSNTVTQWTPGVLEDLMRDVNRAKRGLIVIGRLQEAEEKAAIRELRDRLQWPVFADVGSGLKYESEWEIVDPSLLRGREFLENYSPDCVLHFGKRLVTRHIDDALARWPEASYWVLSSEENVQDPYHLPQRRQFRPDFKQLLGAIEAKPKDAGYLRRIQSLRAGLKSVASPSFNFRDVANVILDHGSDRIFLGNSTAVRAFDSWCFPAVRPGLEAVSNRGVSGIEGLLATTIGLSLAERCLWTLVIGDIAMLHDLNSLLSLAQSHAKVVVVIVNNSGGRIFETLPVQKFPWVKDPLISTPHNFQFAGIGAMAGLDYQLCRDQESFAHSYGQVLKQNRSCIIECQQDGEADLHLTQALAAKEISYE